MTRRAKAAYGRLILAAALGALGLAACSDRGSDQAAPADERQLQVAPDKPAVAAQEPAATAPPAQVLAPKPAAASNTAEATVKEVPLEPDAQVQEDAAASGMTSRTTSTTTTTTERSSSMSNLY